jgi:hypothetical protein
MAALYKIDLEFVRRVDPADITVNGKGRVYTVEIPEDEDFLAWDKPASQQSPKVQAALRALGVTWAEATYPTLEEATGELERRIKHNASVAQGWGTIGTDMGDLLAEGLALARAGNEGAFRAWYDVQKNQMGHTDLDPRGSAIYTALSYGHSREVTIQSSVGPYSGMQPSAQAASEALAALGVAGIRYLDGNSRTAGEGSSNYVVFDDRLVDITEFFQSSRPTNLEQLEADGYDLTRQYYHQTAAAAVEAITTEGFDLTKARARLSDEQVPDGVFLKPDQKNIGVGATGLPGDEVAQVPVFLRIGKTWKFADRAALERNLSQDPEYAELVAEARAYDKAQSVEFDRIWNEMRELDKTDGGREHKAHKLEVGLDAFMDEWKEGNVERATVAPRARDGAPESGRRRNSHSREGSRRL